MEYQYLNFTKFFFKKLDENFGEKKSMWWKLIKINKNLGKQFKKHKNKQ